MLIFFVTATDNGPRHLFADEELLTALKPPPSTASFKSRSQSAPMVKELVHKDLARQRANPNGPDDEDYYTISKIQRENTILSIKPNVKRNSKMSVPIKPILERPKTSKR